jgi:inner membrane protein
MDNVCHTLVGAACARAGLARPARLAATTSMIAANLPDLDVLIFATDVPSVAFRRGWTHGFVAQAVLPLALAGVMFAIGRRMERTRSGAMPQAALGPLLLLSYVGVLSHVFLDYLNNYGVRLLMPFSGRWFYGDSLFIVDPWLWIAFGTATVLGRRGRAGRARTMLIVASIYILAMIGSARAARGIVVDDWQRTYGSAPRALMVGPVPVNPFRKAVIVDAGDHYRTGSFTWSGRQTVYTAGAIAKNDDHPAVRAARHNPRVAGILVWARFPFWDIVPAENGVQVTVRDVRFAGFGRGGFTATTVVGVGGVRP